MKRIRNKSISWKLIINNIINNKYNEINNKTKSDNDTEISDNISLVGKMLKGFLFTMFCWFVFVLTGLLHNRED